MQAFIEEMINLNKNFPCDIRTNITHENVIEDTQTNAIGMKNTLDRYCHTEIENFDHFNNEYIIYIHKFSDYESNTKRRKIIHSMKKRVNHMKEIQGNIAYIPIHVNECHIILMIYNKETNIHSLYDSSGYFLSDFDEYRENIYDLFDHFEVVRSCYKLQGLESSLGYSIFEGGYCMSWVCSIIYMCETFNIYGEELVDKIIEYCESSPLKMRKFIRSFTFLSVVDFDMDLMYEDDSLENLFRYYYRKVF